MQQSDNQLAPRCSSNNNYNTARCSDQCRINTTLTAGDTAAPTLVNSAATLVNSAVSQIKYEGKKMVALKKAAVHFITMRFAK